MFSKSYSWVAALLISCLLGSCGGGGGGDDGGDGDDGGGGSTSAPTGLSYPAPPTFVVNQPIWNLDPTVTGWVATYSVSPALPAGLSLSPNGVISGTPTVITSATTYTIQASNSAGSASATITLTVNDRPPAISYGGSRLAVTAQQSAQITPTSSGGAVVTWSIAPELLCGPVVQHD